MTQFDRLIEKHPGKIFAFLILLAVPVFLVNLGLLPLFADEPTRANVSLEMILSGNYSVPTVGGEYYYNKPPFYNWVLAGLYLLTGSFSEAVTRLPAVVPMFLFAITIYLAVIRFLGNKQVALVSGLFFLLNGRMLIYDSMLGHIDIFYSWLTFISFMLIFHFYERKQWFWLFFSSYLITAVTFLCKGLPSIVFQGFTLITLLVYTRNFKRFFSWQHILSGLVCVLIIGAYFYNYSLYNDNLEGYFNTIWDQSSQRTAGRVPFWKSLIHILVFPFEHLGHVFPASLLALFCFNKPFLKDVQQKPFLKFICLIFLANIWIYWLSPLTRPRYLLMLYPLLFIVWSYAYYAYRDRYPWLDRWVNRIFVALTSLVTISIPAVFLTDVAPLVPYFGFKIGALFVLSVGVTWLSLKTTRHKVIPFMFTLLVIRLAFSWLVLPYRFHKQENNYYKQASIEMGERSKGADFYFYQYHPHELSIPFHHRLIFYIERSRMSLVKFTEDDTKPGYYLTFDRDLKNPRAVLLKTYESNLKLFKVQ